MLVIRKLTPDVPRPTINVFKILIHVKITESLLHFFCVYKYNCGLSELFISTT